MASRAESYANPDPNSDRRSEADGQDHQSSPLRFLRSRPNGLVPSLPRSGSDQISGQPPVVASGIGKPSDELFPAAAGRVHIEPDAEAHTVVAVAARAHPDDRGTAERESSLGTLARAELAEGIKATFVAFIGHAIDIVANAHGFGVLLKGVKVLLKAVEWVQVRDRDRDVDVTFPIPLGSGFELDLSVHLGHSPSVREPLLTAGFAPVSEPDPGVLVVDGCQIVPGGVVDAESADQDEEGAHHILEHKTGEERVRQVDEGGQIIFVPLDLSQLTSHESDWRVRAKAPMCIVRGELLTSLKRQSQWDDLKAEGVECIVFYDQKAKKSVWLFLPGTGKPPIRRRLMFDSAGRLVLRGS